MQWLLANVWLLAVLPAALAALIMLAGKTHSMTAPLLALPGPLLTIVASLAALATIGHQPTGVAEAEYHSALAAPALHVTWFEVGEKTLRLSWAVDSLAAVMLLVVGVVAACVVVFSVGYLHAEAGWVRYFALLSLFTGSMNLLVTSNSFTTLFMGWELVGACSFLLIGFWYERPAAVAAATKAFVTTRVGDVGLLLGIAILWQANGTDVFVSGFGAEALSPAAVTAAALCLAVGAMGKSAQFPLHGWLPDAMEGPTPVSALIHAATMVAAGVYLGARAWPIFEAAPAALTLLLVAGVISALGGALAALGQSDIKKVLAYSTISQLGFMFAALGAGAWSAAFFHLVTHAAFKALLFLTSGSVIHGSGTQDLREMGGLARSMPVTFGVWMVGVSALAGIAPLSGFFSKDAVLESVWHAAPVAGAALFVASAVTAVYAARTTRLAFFGPPRGDRRAHEAPAAMRAPLVLLAVPAALAGFAHHPLGEILHHEAEPLSLLVSVLALSLAAAGGTLGWRLASDAPAVAVLRERLANVERVLAAAYGWDRFVDRVVVRPVVSMSRVLHAWGDRFVADGLAEGSAYLARRLGASLVRVQSGDAQSYATAVTAGAALILAAAIWLGRG
jgi:NADH-quinone oxidoreductase subunit L